MDFASVLEAGGSLALSIGVFAFAVWLNRKTNSPLLNPLLVTVAIIMIGLTVFNIPLDSYEKGATLISVSYTHLDVYKRQRLRMRTPRLPTRPSHRAFPAMDRRSPWRHQNHRVRRAARKL